ncbi:MAG TPA: PAS domain S-box protein [Thermoanaerobaculia bacterium]|nr:PAS domain S-box protein [Thermoanaerobaculia bacterium]
MHIHLPAALDINEQALEEVFRHTPVGVVLTDLHGAILDANLAFCAMLGRHRDDIVGQTFGAFVHPEEAEDAQRSIGRLREEEVSSLETVRRWIASDGRTLTTKVTASIVRSKDGEPICGIGFIEDVGERMAMERALRESETRYRRVVEDQTELIVRCLPDGTRTFVNEAYCRYSEATAEELIGTSFFPCIPEEEQELVRNKYATLTVEHPVATDEHRVFTARGMMRWHRWTDRGIFDATGTLVEIQAVGRDITEERESQDLLRRSEQNYRRLYGALPVAVWETDFSETLPAMLRLGLDTPEKLIAAVEENPALFFELAKHSKVVTANGPALALAGASTPQALFEWLAARYTTEAAVAYVRSAASLFLGDTRVADIELPLRAPDGRRIDLLQRLARLPTWLAEPRLIAITLDVTDRRRIERDLLHRQQILEEAEVLARIGSYEWDVSTDQVFGSAGFWGIFTGEAQARFGSVEEVVACFREDFQPRIRERFAWMARHGHRHESADRESILVHQDGTTIIARGASFAERNAAGDVARVYGIVQDVTEQRQVEQAAQREREAMTRADKMISLGVLVSGVAHEINNPNHSIMLNAPLLADAWKSIVPIVDRHVALEGETRIGNIPWDEMRAEGKAMIEDIEQAAQRIRGIVTELRGFALDHHPGERRPVSMNDVVKSSLRLLGNHIRKATSRFSTVLAPDLPDVHGNQGRLEQVLVNLIINACQALASADCSIVIETGRTPAHVFVRVTDEGQGISPEDLRKIKDPFFTTKRATGGSGLGLAVSDRIAEEHGGELTFESEPGRGTTATLSIPVLSIPEQEHAWQPS